MSTQNTEHDKLRTGRRLLLLLLAGLLFATLAATIAAVAQRDHVPSHPGTPATHTTTGDPR